MERSKGKSEVRVQRLIDERKRRGRKKQREINRQWNEKENGKDIKKRIREREKERRVRVSDFSSCRLLGSRTCLIPEGDHLIYRKNELQS